MKSFYKKIIRKNFLKSKNKHWLEIFKNLSYYLYIKIKKKKGKIMEKRYNLIYETEGKRIEKKNITQAEVQEFLNHLEKKNESSLYIKQIHEKEEEEEER